MARKSNRQIEIDAARRELADVESIARENQTIDGGRAYRETWHWHYEKGGAGRALRTLKGHGEACPEFIKRSFPTWGF